MQRAINLFDALPQKLFFSGCFLRIFFCICLMTVCSCWFYLLYPFLLHAVFPCLSFTKRFLFSWSLHGNSRLTLPLRPQKSSLLDPQNCSASLTEWILACVCIRIRSFLYHSCITMKKLWLYYTIFFSFTISPPPHPSPAPLRTDRQTSLQMQLP